MSKTKAKQQSSMNGNGSAARPSAAITLNLDEFSEPAGDLVIDGARYHFRQWSMFNLIEQRTIRRDWMRAATIGEQDDVTTDEMRERTDLMRALVRRITDMPDDVALSDERMGIIIGVFFQMRAVTVIQQNGRIAGTVAPLTGEISSRDSISDGPRETPLNG